MSTTISIILDTRRIKIKNSKYPVKLRVTFERTVRSYQTVYDLSKEEHQKLNASRINSELQNIREKLKEIERTAENAARELEPFSFQDFERNFIFTNYLFRQRKSKSPVTPLLNTEYDYSPFEEKFYILKERCDDPYTTCGAYTTYIKKLLIEGRIGTAYSYHNSYQSLKKFRGNVRLTDITVSFLKQYEQWMHGLNNSKSTIGIYVRALRTIFNESIEIGIIKREKCYPFGRRKYKIPTSRNVKKALDLNAIQKIYYYKPEFESECKARDFWLFCYFANGMNPKDVIRLKYKNIEGEYLIFERAKTELTSCTDPRPITVYITEDMRKIIRRWSNKDKKPNNYIFPILDHGLSPMREYELTQLFIRFINDWMLKIRKKLGIEKKVTTYVARHTFSTVMKRSGVSTEFIQEALGHSSISTTESYLDSFEKEVKKEYAKNLIAFKKEK